MLCICGLPAFGPGGACPAGDPRQQVSQSTSGITTCPICPDHLGGAQRIRQEKKHIPWETDFYAPQVLGGAALFDNSAPAMYKIQGP